MDKNIIMPDRGPYEIPKKIKWTLAKKLLGFLAFIFVLLTLYYFK